MRLKVLPQVHPGHCDPSWPLFVFCCCPTPISRSFVRSFVRWFRHEEIEMRQTRESIKWKLISVMDRRADGNRNAFQWMDFHYANRHERINSHREKLTTANWAPFFNHFQKPMRRAMGTRTTSRIKWEF
jgi:hypothetical protein